ncbi:MAG TPA: energy transducer TonB [Solirubrobacterales bacterium]|nr:energy transducer TonB [Solirubrobacterales bacterium]
MKTTILLGAGLLALAVAVPAVAADLVDPGANYQELKQAAALVQRGQAQQAIDKVKLLDQISGGRCGECQVVLAQAYLAAGDRAHAADAARSAIAQLNDLSQQATANAALAFALADPQDPRGTNLPDAEAAVRQAIEQGTDPKLQSWGFRTLTWILLRREHYGDLVAEARDYLENSPSGPQAAYAKRMVCAGRALGDVAGPDAVVTPARGQGVVAPRPVFHPDPGYTAQAQANGLHGRVVVSGVVDTEGCLVDPRVARGLDGGTFDQHVLDVVQLWTFRPAIRNGRPVPAAYSATLTY